MFRKTPQIIKIALTPKQKVQKLMTDIGGGWYMKKNDKGLPSLIRKEKRKNHNKGIMKFKKTI